MNPSLVFTILIAIIVVNYFIDLIIDSLNAKKYDAPIPFELQDVYPEEDYQKSMEYKKVNHKFSLVTGSFSIILTLAFFFFEGFQKVNEIALSISEHPIIVGLIFFGIIMIGNDIITTPFAYYKNFVIEERFGFNKMTVGTFIGDKVKGWLMTTIIGGGMLALIIWFYDIAGTNFWIYAWALVTFFSVFMNMFYAKLIVPIFNKQTPLEPGSLRDKIEAYGNKVGFKLDKIFVIDGSKRSTKANAYFSGFGSEKRVTLFDTLINDLDEDEIVAVFAHEVGHYKRKHIIYNLSISVLLTGFTLWLLSLFVSQDIFSQALGVEQATFHIGLIAFGILYTPISEITGLIMNILSRKFEYQADDYAKETFGGESLITSLKKLSKNSLSNLTPHPAYEFYHYSHPSLLKRVQNLRK